LRMFSCSISNGIPITMLIRTAGIRCYAMPTMHHNSRVGTAP
jgi:hypothetical protein